MRELTGSFTIEINGGNDSICLTYNSLDNFDNQFNKSYYYSVYNEQQTINKLFELQIRQNFANVILLFDNEKLNNLLTHINVFDFFCYTLIPEDIDKEVYKRIYDFFFYSPLSVSYITWVGSLIFKPKINTNSVKINGENINLGNCNGCFLQKRNCSKIIPFLNIYHPEKELNTGDIELMCTILRDFSVKVFNDFSSVLSCESFKPFALARKSVGIKNHYWLNPFGVY